MKDYVYVMALKKIIDGIYVSDDGSNGGNHGAIVLDDEVVMIDSGMMHPKSAETRQFIESETGLQISKLVFTSCEFISKSQNFSEYHIQFQYQYLYPMVKKLY